MKRKVIPVFVVLVLLLLIVGGAAAFRYMDRFIPTKETADIEEVLGVSGEDTAFYYNNERLNDVSVIVRDGQAYLPAGWVSGNLNEKFYWDEKEKLLVYTLPDTIVYADKRTMGSGGQPLLLAEGDGIWLSLGLVASYTNIRSELFTSPVNRLFLYDNWEPQTVGTASRKMPVRVKGGIKSPILTTVEEGGEFTVLETGEEWTRVRTTDGYIGWVQMKHIGDTSERKQISTFTEPEYTSLSLGRPVCMAWHQTLKAEDNANMEQLVARTQGAVNVIAPTWLMLTDNNGNFESLASQDYVDKAHALGLQVWAVLDNFNKGDHVDSAVLFARTSVRKALVDRLMEEARRYGLDGLNLDIESISKEAQPHYVQFIRELSVACRKNGLILSVDNYVPSEYTRGYNRAEQGRVADYVIIMGYDEHYSGGDPGPTASLPFVEGGIVDTLAEVPAEKVINAVPFYTRRWEEEAGTVNSTALGLEAARKWVEENDVSLYWQDELGLYYGELTTENGVQTIWLEDERSLELKMGLIREYGLAGVAGWKLGLDTEEIWSIINENE